MLRAYCYLRTKHLFELHWSGIFFAILYPSPKSLRRTLRTSVCFTSKSVCSFTLITIESAFWMGTLPYSSSSATDFIAFLAYLLRFSLRISFCCFSGCCVASMTSLLTNILEILYSLAISCWCMCSSVYNLTISVRIVDGSSFLCLFLHLLVRPRADCLHLFSCASESPSGLCSGIALACPMRSLVACCGSRP